MKCEKCGYDPKEKKKSAFEEWSGKQTGSPIATEFRKQGWTAAVQACRKKMNQNGFVYSAKLLEELLP